MGSNHNDGSRGIWETGCNFHTRARPCRWRNVFDNVWNDHSFWVCVFLSLCFLFFLMVCQNFSISALQYVDLRSSRNLYIIGVSLFFPLVLCPWMQKNPGVISTNIEVLDSSLSVLLGTSILVGGALGCFLDHVIPGTLEERGVIGWSKEMELKTDRSSTEASTYDFPYFMSFLKKCKASYYLPFSPTYGMKQSC